MSVISTDRWWHNSGLEAKTLSALGRGQDVVGPDGHSAADRRHPPPAGQIDQLVYELYGLTDDEIRIVEEATKETQKRRNAEQTLTPGPSPRHGGISTWEGEENGSGVEEFKRLKGEKGMKREVGSVE